VTLSNKKHFTTSSRLAEQPARLITLTRYSFHGGNSSVHLNPSDISYVGPPERGSGGARIAIRSRGVEPFDVIEEPEVVLALIRGDKTAQKVNEA